MAEPQREWFEKDFYKVLGVAENASEKEITKAYRKLARELHPDANPGDAAAEERFKAVSAAYDVIGDEDKRKSYDEVRRLGPMAGGFGGGAGAPGGFNMDIGDLLGGLFGRGGGGGGRARGGASRGQKGADLEADLALDFEDAVNGIETTIHLNDGDGPRDIKARIPPGVTTGKKIRLKGRGRPAGWAVHPAISSSRSPSAITTSSVEPATTSRSRCRSPSPRPPSAPTSRCRPSMQVP